MVTVHHEEKRRKPHKVSMKDKNKIKPVKPTQKLKEKPDGFDDVTKFLNETGEKLEQFERWVDGIEERIELKTERKMSELEDNWHDAQQWLAQQIDKLKLAEREAEKTVDTVKVKSHLAKMELKEKSQELTVQVDRIGSQIDRLLDKASSEAGKALQNLSEVCLNLKKKLGNREAH